MTDLPHVVVKDVGDHSSGMPPGPPALVPLSPDNPRWDLSRPGAAVGGERLLVTVCVHGNEPCGMLAANELLKEGFFDFASAGDADAWPADVNSLTVIVGNPDSLRIGKRCIDTNLNRLFGPDGPQPSRPASAASNSAAPQRDGSPGAAAAQTSDSAADSEQRRVPELAAAISAATQFVDIHSSSAAAPAFAFHWPGAGGFAATFPVAYAVETDAIPGITTDLANRQGNRRAVLVECGQHNARESVETAKQVIRRLVTGEVRRAGGALVTAGSVKVSRGFRYIQPVKAFQHVAHGEAVAQDEEQGDIRCPLPGGALIVMPTELPVEGEEAWLWGVKTD